MKIFLTIYQYHTNIMSGNHDLLFLQLNSREDDWLLPLLIYIYHKNKLLLLKYGLNKAVLWIFTKKLVRRFVIFRSSLLFALQTWSTTDTDFYCMNYQRINYYSRCLNELILFVFKPYEAFLLCCEGFVKILISYWKKKHWASRIWVGRQRELILG